MNRIAPISPKARPSANSLRPQPAPRRGAFLVVAMICLILATALVGVLLNLARTQRRQMSQHQMRLQADWIAESAFERAAARLRDDPAYAGETWSISAEDLGVADSDGAGGEAVIRIEVPVQQPLHRIVHVEAVYPREQTLRVRRNRQTTIILSQES